MNYGTNPAPKSPAPNIPGSQTKRMKVYRFENNIACPVQESIVIAEDKEEALKITIKETGIKKGWEFDEEYEIKKGLLFWGDADC